MKSAIFKFASLAVLIITIFFSFSSSAYGQWWWDDYYYYDDYYKNYDDYYKYYDDDYSQYYYPVDDYYKYYDDYYKYYDDTYYYYPTPYGSPYTYPTPPSPAPTVNLYVNFSTAPAAVPYGNNVIITWDTANSPTSCSASSTDNIWSGSKTTSGGLEIAGALYGPRTYTFTITCSNSSGSNTKSVPIYANAVSRQECPGECHTDGRNLPDGQGGTHYCAPNQPGPESCPSTCHTDTQYKYDGTSCSPTRVCSPNAPARQNPPACRTTGGTLDDGKCGTYSYSDNCSGVCSGSTCILPPTVDLRINNSNGPVTIDNTGSAALSWTTTNSPASCSASGAWSGNKSTSGRSENTGTLYGPWTYTYSISCSNSAGTSSPDSVTVNVNGPPVVSIEDQVRRAIEDALRTIPGGIR